MTEAELEKAVELHREIRGLRRGLDWWEGRETPDIPAWEMDLHDIPSWKAYKRASQEMLQRKIEVLEKKLREL